MKKVLNYIYVSVLGAGLVCSQSILADEAEVEQNNPVALAQFITPGSGEFDLDGVLGVVSGTAVEDLDFYKFFGQAGDVVTIDIDGGMGGMRSVDTVIAVFSDGPDYTMLRLNDDSYPLDEGSNYVYDSRIDNFVLPATGNYYVGVSHYPRYFTSGGTARSAYPRNGDYKLVVSGVSSPVVNMNISIKPGHNEVAPLNPKARGRVPVALLSSREFDPAEVDVESLTFGHDGDEASLEKCNKSRSDINHDGVADMVCHFDNQAASFRKGDLEGILKGKLKDGTMFEGRGLLKVVPEKAN
ncbi:MAG: PPC domain-containing protein [Gammaproteobacteria bacterium]|jgi:hypothetical protein